MSNDCDSGWDIEDDDHPEWQNQCEVDVALELILGGRLDPNYFNTGDWINECRQRLENPALQPTSVAAIYDAEVDKGFSPDPLPAEEEAYCVEGNAGLESLQYIESAWKLLEGKYGIAEYRHLISDFPTLVNRDATDAFVEHVFSGRYPPPEVMLAIAKCLKLYLRSGGSLSLEEVFYGKPLKKNKRYSSKSRRNAMYLSFHNLARFEKSIPDISREAGLNQYEADSLEEIAEGFLVNRKVSLELDDEQDMDVDSFLRGYRRWKRENPKLSDI